MKIARAYGKQRCEWVTFYIKILIIKNFQTHSRHTNNKLKPGKIGLV